MINQIFTFYFMSYYSIVYLTGQSTSSCGYCHSKIDSSISIGMWAYSLTVQQYQKMIDCGWRRSGQYLYKPDISKTCCPAYTIRLNAFEFQTSKGQVKVLKKMQKFLLRGKEAVKSDSKLKLDEDMTESMEVDPTPAKKQTAPTDLLEPQCSVPDFEMTEIESKPNAPPANVILKAKPVLLRKTGIENLISTTESHNPLNVNQLEVKLERAVFSNDVYELYVKYQMKIHDDEANELTPEKFTRFLLDTPYDVKDPNYGIFYQKYFINDKLVAVGVLDILPNCVSSVYFIYDPDFGHLSLGTYSALKEISTTIMLNQKYPDIKYYYLGYYIHSCQKMRYKAQYKPSQLLCPYTFKWVYTSDAIKLLDIEKTSVLADLDSSNPIPVKLSSVPPREISLEDLRHAKLLVNHKMQPALKFINDLSLIKDIKELIQASGVDVIKDLLFIYNPE